MSARIGALMLVDDDSLDQRLHRRIIERSGVVDEIVQFTSARDALDHLFSGATVDAILLDVRMPGMDGFDFLDELVDRRDTRLREVVILMLTTSLDPADQARAASYDVVRDYLYKPLDVDHLAELADLVAAGQGPRG